MNAPWIGAMALCALLGCGSRTEPLIERVDGRVVRPDTGVPIDSSMVDAGPPPRCRYVPHGEPMALFTESAHGEGLSSPRMVVLEAGGGGVETRLVFSIIHEHFWHSDARLAEVFVGDAWPAGVRMGAPMIRVGMDAHSPVRITATIVDDRIAVAWYRGDEAAGRTAGVRFRSFDTAAWSPGDEILIEEDAPFAASLTPLPDGTFALVYRSATVGESRETRLAFLDADGRPVGDPITVIPERPGSSATGTWTGDELLVAFNTADATVVSRVDRGSRELFETARVPAIPGRRPRSPTIHAHRDGAWAAWREEVPMDTGAGYVLRVARLTRDGELLGLPLEERAEPLTGPELHVSDDGVVLIWGEPGDRTLMRNEEGFTRLVGIHLGLDGAELARFEIPATSNRGSEYIAAQAIGGRRLLVSWSAQPVGEAGTSIIHLARFDCVVDDD